MSQSYEGPSTLVSAGDMSASITSSVFPIRHSSNVALAIVWTGSPTGTFSVECSVDYNPTTGVAGTWVALTLSPSPAAAGSGSSALIDLNQLGAPYLRVKYTFTSGTGALNVFAFGKGL